MEVLPFLDRHLIYPLLDFWQEVGVYDDVTMLNAKLDILQQTNMPGHCGELYKQIHNVENVPEQFTERATAIDAEFEQLEQESRVVLQVLENPEVVGALKQDKAQNLTFLRESHGISIEQINVLYRLGQFEYNRGNYAGAIDHLYHFRVLTTDPNMTMAATWGKLAAEILEARWDDAFAELTKLKEQIDGDGSNGPFQLKSRLWWLHWALYPLLKNTAMRIAELQEFFFSPAYLNALQSGAPHLTKYLSVAVLITSGSKVNQPSQARRVRDLLKLVETDVKQQDPVTKFVTCTLSAFDFEGAAELYPKVLTLIDEDYFLHQGRSQIMKSMLVLLIELYLRLHMHTSLSRLSQMLNVPKSDIVEIIQSDLSSLGAEIDEEDDIIELPIVAATNPLPETIQRIIERNHISAATMQAKTKTFRPLQYSQA